MISRLAEMYLISAEAQGLNGGLDRLNELREKRGLDRVSPGKDADFLDAVLQERRLEFLAEGFRWYDLVRTGKARHEGLPVPDAASEPGVALQSEPQTE